MSIRDDRIDRRKEAEQDQVMAELDDAALANCLEKQLTFHATVLDLDQGRHPRCPPTAPTRWEPALMRTLHAAVTALALFVFVASLDETLIVVRRLQGMQKLGVLLIVCSGAVLAALSVVGVFFSYRRRGP